MKTELKNSFMQAAFGTMLWVVLLITLFDRQQTIQIMDLWRLIGISLLAGGVFGVIYPYLWNYSTFKAVTNITLSTVANVVAGYSGLYLFSTELFRFIFPYMIIITAVTLVGHIGGFYLYSNHKNNQMAVDLNQKLEGK